MINTPPIVLASSSPFRRALLERLALRFETASPDVDESPRPDEPPQHLVARLAQTKARAVAAGYPNALIIGSDQVAVLGQQLLGKPGEHGKAVSQLKQASGKTVSFFTAVCLLNTRDDQLQCEVVPYEVEFRELTEKEIDHYLRHERPYNCAGSFKSEGLGVALFRKQRGDDPTSLIGLPLIRLVEMLRVAGVNVLA